MADVADGGERGRSDLILSCALCDVRFLWDLRFESAFEFELEYLPLPQLFEVTTTGSSQHFHIQAEEL